MNSFATAIRRSGMGPVLGMVVTIIVANALLQDRFFSYDAFASNVSSLAPLILVSLGQSILILNRELDLSVGAGISLINCILASWGGEQFGGIAGQLAAAFAISMCLGFVNGILVAVMGLNSLIVTFGTSALWYGIALLVMPQPGGAVADRFGDLYSSAVVGIPAPLLVIIFGMAVWTIVERHRFGRWLIGVGSNPDAAFQAGIPVVIVKIGVYLLSWCFVFLSAVSISAQTLSGDARLGQTYTLSSVAACVIGGVALNGGRGSPWGALIGTIVLGLIGNVIYFAGVPSAWQQFAKGLVVVAALGFMVIEQRIWVRARFDQ